MGGPPVITHFYGIFHYKRSIFGDPHLWTPPHLGAAQWPVAFEAGMMPRATQSGGASFRVLGCHTRFFPFLNSVRDLVKSLLGTSGPRFGSAVL